MARPKNEVPSYRLHKQSGQAIVTLTENGVRRDVLLGKHGTPESKEEYERILKTLRTGASIPTSTADAADVTVAELMAKFMAHAERHYRRPDGTATNEVNNYVLSF